MNAIRFIAVMVFDGSGKDSFPGELTVTGNRMDVVTRGTGQRADEEDLEMVNGNGACPMQGLVEAHGHIICSDVAPRTALVAVSSQKQTASRAGRSDTSSSLDSPDSASFVLIVSDWSRF